MMTDTFLFTHLVLHGTAVFKVAKAMTRFEERKKKRFPQKESMDRSLASPRVRQTDRDSGR